MPEQNLLAAGGKPEIASLARVQLGPALFFLNGLAHLPGYGKCGVDIPTGDCRIFQTLFPQIALITVNYLVSHLTFLDLKSFVFITVSVE